MPGVNTQTFLINRVVKAASFVLVDFKACANDRVAFVLDDKVGHYFLWCHFACLADHQNFRLLMSSTCVVRRRRKSATTIASPTATSAAATVMMKKTKTCAL